MATALPERLGKYAITEVLGEGAMGIVYKGHDPDIRREVAIKTLRTAALLRGDDGVPQADRFRNEAQAAGRLQHPGIVAVYDYGHAPGVDGGIDFIAMEYVRGHTLSRYLTQLVSGALTMSDDDVLSIVGQLLEALAHAHEQGVWHRDIKPSNLIMTRGGRIKVTDFGIARIESANLTRAASLIGTPMYMAPEQFQGRPIDHRVDLYAVGVVLYQLLCGHPPFVGPAESLMYRAVHEPHVPPSRQPGKAHLAAYDEVLARALAKDAAQRYATADAFRQALAAVVGRRLNEAVSEATVTALLPLRPGAPAADRATHASATAPTVFDPAVLAQAESLLARLVGPMAQLMVKRAARDSADLYALLGRLAEQLDNPALRQQFVQQMSPVLAGNTAGHTAGTAGSAGSAQSTHSRGSGGRLLGNWRSLGAGGGSGNPGATAPPPAAPALSADVALTASLQDAAQRLLAQQLGPIAQVLVRRAANGCTQRAPFLQKLAEALTAAVPQPDQRQSLLQALARLPD